VSGYIDLDEVVLNRGNHLRVFSPGPPATSPKSWSATLGQLLQRLNSSLVLLVLLAALRLCVRFFFQPINDAGSTRRASPLSISLIRVYRFIGGLFFNSTLPEGLTLIPVFGSRVPKMNVAACFQSHTSSP